MNINFFLELRKYDFLDLKDDLTTEQKAAFICALILLATSDKEIDENETKVIEDIMLLMHFDPLNPTLIVYLRGGKEMLFSTISTFDKNIKESFLLFAYLITITDKNIKSIEAANIEILCKEIDISMNDYYLLIDKYLDNCTDFKDVYHAMFYK